MAHVLSRERVASYRANGFLTPFDALTPDEVAHYRAELERSERHVGGSLMAVDRKYRGNMHLCCRWVDQLARHPRILDVVEDIIGPDILLFTSRFFIKEPMTDGIAAWHQDSTYFGLRPFEHITAWVALSDVTLEAGPLEFAVGSHYRGQLQQKSNVVGNSVNTAGQIIVEWFDRSEIAVSPLAPGQFSLHHTCVVHQSGPNRTNARRIGLALSFVPPRVRHIGNHRMPATLVRGQDTHGHFDLLPAPERDFGPDETRRHDTAFKSYIDSFYEQLAIVEKDLPANLDATALMH